MNTVAEDVYSVCFSVNFSPIPLRINSFSQRRKNDKWIIPVNKLIPLPE